MRDANSSYREMRISLTEVPRFDPASGETESVAIDWVVRVKALHDAWGTGTVVATGRERRTEGLESSEDALEYLYKVLCRWNDVRM